MIKVEMPVMMKARLRMREALRRWWRGGLRWQSHSMWEGGEVTVAPSEGALVEP